MHYFSDHLSTRALYSLSQRLFLWQVTIQVDQYLIIIFKSCFLEITLEYFFFLPGSPKKSSKNKLLTVQWKRRLWISSQFIIFSKFFNKYPVLHKNTWGSSSEAKNALCKKTWYLKFGWKAMKQQFCCLWSLKSSFF